MRILLAASEAVPFAKTGGLADVASGLSTALAARGHEVTLILPHHRQLIPADLPRERTGQSIEVRLRNRRVNAELVRSLLPDSAVRVLLIDQPQFFDRPSLYVQSGAGAGAGAGADYPDNCERFCFFSRAVMQTARALDLRPDVIHVNDWQTGLIPALLQMEYRSRPGFENTAAVMTIHNLAFQGSFWAFDMELTGLDTALFNWRQMEHYGNLNLLKTGIVFSDAVTTVSPSYAREIQTAEFGCGLEGVLQHRADRLSGILNGIDTGSWDPQTDASLPANFNAETVPVGKPACKAWLQEHLHLPVRPEAPLLGMITRLTDQKGLDLIAADADTLLGQDVQMVFLGTGEARYEELLRGLARRAPEKVAAAIGFDEPLARRIEAGADLFLMPSRFEPCGLNQMYSMRYGTVPVVHSVGGLADSVTDCTNETLARATATGFQFTPYSPSAFLNRLRDALALYRRADDWQRLIQNGMRSDWSWSRSAAQYEGVYAAARARLPSHSAR